MEEKNSSSCFSALTCLPAVHKTVVHFQAHAQRLTAICRDIFAPGDAGNVVVLIKVPLVGAAGQVEPRCTGKIDQIVQLSALVQKGLLGFAFGTGGAAEAVQIALLRQCDDVELLAAGLQVGEAGHALVQQPDLPAADGIAEVLHGVDRIGHQIPQRIVKGNAMGPCVSMEIGHIHSEGDAVKRLGHRREKPEQLRPRPDGKVDFLHERSLHIVQLHGFRAAVFVLFIIADQGAVGVPQGDHVDVLVLFDVVVGVNKVVIFVGGKPVDDPLDGLAGLRIVAGQYAFAQQGSTAMLCIAGNGGGVHIDDGVFQVADHDRRSSASLSASRMTRKDRFGRSSPVRKISA